MFRFNLIKENQATKFEGKVVKISDTITLQNNDKIREVAIAINKEIKVFFLYDFITPTFKINENVKLLVVDDFIQGVIVNEN